MSKPDSRFAFNALKMVDGDRLANYCLELTHPHSAEMEYNHYQRLDFSNSKDCIVKYSADFKKKKVGVVTITKEFHALDLYNKYYKDNAGYQNLDSLWQGLEDLKTHFMAGDREAYRAAEEYIYCCDRQIKKIKECQNLMLGKLGCQAAEELYTESSNSVYDAINAQQKYAKSILSKAEERECHALKEEEIRQLKSAIDILAMYGRASNE